MKFQGRKREENEEETGGRNGRKKRGETGRNGVKDLIRRLGHRDSAGGVAGKRLVQLRPAGSAGKGLHADSSSELFTEYSVAQREPRVRCLAQSSGMRLFYHSLRKALIPALSIVAGAPSHKIQIYGGARTQPEVRTRAGPAPFRSMLHQARPNRILLNVNQSSPEMFVV